MVVEARGTHLLAPAWTHTCGCCDVWDAGHQGQSPQMAFSAFRECQHPLLTLSEDGK